MRSKAGPLVFTLVAVAAGMAAAIGITDMPTTKQSDTPAVAQATDISTITAQTATSPDSQNLEEKLYAAKCVGIRDTSQYAKISVLDKAGKLVTSVIFVKEIEPGSRRVFNGGSVNLTRGYFPCLDGVVDAENNLVYGLAAYTGTKGPSLIRSLDFAGRPVSDYWTKEPIGGIAIAYGVTDGNNYVVSIGQTLGGKPVVHLLKTDGLELAATYILQGKEGSPSDLQVIPIKGKNDSLLQFKLRSEFDLISGKPGKPHSILASEVLTKYGITPPK